MIELKKVITLKELREQMKPDDMIIYHKDSKLDINNPAATTNDKVNIKVIEMYQNCIAYNLKAFNKSEIGPCYWYVIEVVK